MSAPDELTDRQREIVRLVGQQSYSTIEALAQRFEVSMQSIRRDVIHLDRLKLLQRFHGGAGATDNTVRLGYGEKRLQALDAKQRIARAAAALVPPGSSIFLDVGTTTEALARSLAEREVALRVFTNSMAIAMALAGRRQLELYVFGGSVRGADGSLTGAATLAGIDAMGFDVCFIGCSGVDDRGRATDYDLEKIAVKQGAMRRSDSRVLLADATKFERRAIAAIAPLADFASVVSDGEPNAALRAEIGRLVIAD
ncbi:DeoR/GlpR family DNA-binding transcription regulator [Aureimonas mangrovi]|uniref:DeoR/GlpR family DNA-binding transcription regulator n=1 Tax=Aureimonas mangrovi TaxID=2758041 RepID=UPI001AEE73AA|nr:DeoR/GlpR family DNA-binding transcription regulator [Aureimonas mangrovi]